MARGFDSKSVADQQEDAQRRAERKTARPLEARVKTLELSRTDVLNRLNAAEAAGQERLVTMLRQALQHLEGELERATAAAKAEPGR